MDDYDEEDDDSVPVQDKSQSGKSEAKEVQQTDDEFNKILNSEMEKQKADVAKQAKTKLEIRSVSNKEETNAEDVEDALAMAFNNDKKKVPAAPSSKGNVKVQLPVQTTENGSVKSVSEKRTPVSIPDRTPPSSTPSKLPAFDAPEQAQNDE